MYNKHENFNIKIVIARLALIRCSQIQIEVKSIMPVEIIKHFYLHHLFLYFYFRLRLLVICLRVNMDITDFIDILSQKVRDVPSRVHSMAH